MAFGSNETVKKWYEDSEKHFGHWEKVKDVTDQLIDLMLNYRQSGHPGGSRSKVYMLVSTLLSGAMRWDIRKPEKRFADRFVLVAGHTAPLVYATLCVLNDVMRTKYKETGDEKYKVPVNRAVLWEDILKFRHQGGLPGHAEMAGKTLFYKANTGPSGHGTPVAAGEAMALKRAGIEDVKVFAIEGEGGMTAGVTHETKNSAWGLGLSNLVYEVDWNDFGIDDHAMSSIVYGNPKLWFESYGWRVQGTEEGENWDHITKEVLEATYGENPEGLPNAVWFKTRKGRGYYKYDNKSHGAPHKTNSDLFWKCRKDFADKYGVEWDSFGAPLTNQNDHYRQFKANLNVALDVIRNDKEMLNCLANRMVEIGDSVPDEIKTFKLSDKGNPFKDDEMVDFERYPDDIWAKPGDNKANRNALAAWGAYINAWSKKKYNRPVFLACSADLADSTNISGFAKDYNDIKGYGWYDRKHNPDGVLLPQGITEFANAGIMCGIAGVNLAKNPCQEWDGFMGACSTYGSFVYLKYGPMRIFSQTAQDSDIKLGKVIWVAGHSGPETADDSRTHFGIFAPGVTNLFPEGQVIDVHPWEYNEVPVVIAAALKTTSPIIALHLTRPGIEIPDREALGIPSHFEAAKGAYIMRNYRDDQPKRGCIFVQGTSSTNNLIKILPKLDEEKINVKIIAAISPQLFRLQSEAYQRDIISDADRFDSTMITNRSRKLCSDWYFNPLAEEYTLSSDWDNRWRTGGTLDEVIAEAKLSPEHILNGIKRFAADREKRLERLSRMTAAAKNI